jgi:hypothetical protein
VQDADDFAYYGAAARLLGRAAGAVADSTAPWHVLCLDAPRGSNGLVE